MHKVVKKNVEKVAKQFSDRTPKMLAKMVCKLEMRLYIQFRLIPLQSNPKILIFNLYFGIKFENKIIELEGIQRDFQLFQKQFTIENHKNIAMIKEKEKEIGIRIHGKVIILIIYRRTLIRVQSQLHKGANERLSHLQYIKSFMLFLLCLAIPGTIYAQIQLKLFFRSQGCPVLKEKEIKDLHKKLMTLEESSGDIEKKYNQLNPMKMKQKEPEPTTKEEKIKAKRDAEAVAHLTPQERKNIEEVKGLKATILNQEEEIQVLKDMVRSTALQIKVRDQEMKRIRKRGESQTIPSSPSQIKRAQGNKSTLLPSLLNDSSTSAGDYDTFKEPSKMEKLTQLSNKFRNQQAKGRTTDKGTQTGGGGQKHMAIQAVVQSTRVDMAVQLEVPKKAERSVQTVGLGGVCEIQRQVLKMEVFKSEKPKKKKKKKEKKPPQAPNPDGSIPEAEEEESYYEYYEEEVEEEEPGGVTSPSGQNQGMVLSTGGVPIYVNNAKKGV